MNEEEIIKKLVTEEIKLYQVEKLVNGDIEKATTIRRKALEKISNTKLEFIGKYPIDISLTASRNIENPIGCTSTPTIKSQPRILSPYQYCFYKEKETTK